MILIILLCLLNLAGSSVISYSWKYYYYLSNMKGHFSYSFFFFFLITLGPPLPKGLESFSMLQIHGDAYIFGGWSGGYNSVIYQLTCSSGICSWSTLNQELKVARRFTVAIPVPDTFCV